jgi:hypothetical protein
VGRGSDRRSGLGEAEDAQDSEPGLAMRRFSQTDRPVLEVDNKPVFVAQRVDNFGHVRRDVHPLMLPHRRSARVQHKASSVRYHGEFGRYWDVAWYEKPM